MPALGSAEKPLRVAIVGAGPSGFYAADALFKSAIEVTVDCFDRLATPFGLLRGGVAPDHQKMKSVGAYYDRVATTNSHRFRFFGNVAVGIDITIDELRQYYDAVIVSVGAQSDRRLGVPGEDLTGSHSATEFVGWYNGHPDFQQCQFDLKADSVAVVGQGNVAIDVTRILAKPIAELRKTDIPESILNKLENASIKHIHLIGRRGPVQSAFTELEIKELGEIPNCRVVINAADMILNPSSEAELADPANTKAKKNMAVLEHYNGGGANSGEKTIYIRFLESPVEILGDNFVTGLKVEKNRLTGEPGSQKAVGTGEFETIPCGLVFKSIGYKGVPLPGLPFDEASGKIPNQKGAVVENGQPVPGLFVAGWIKRGPKGVLGTNKPCSTETVQTLIEQLNNLSPAEIRSESAVIELLNAKQIRFVTYEDWQKIDAIEKEKGAILNKPREKFTSTAEILNELGVSHGVS
ncbi:NADP oxidoreductase [bacterium]|nr:NADP oxidoreductase [bacterium]